VFMADHVVVGGTYGSVPNKPKASSATDSESPLLFREEDRFRTDSAYKDVLFAVLFVLYLVLITILSIFFFAQNQSTYGSNTSNTESEFLNQHFWRLSFVTITIAICNTFVSFLIVAKFAFYLIWFTLICSFILWLVYGICLLVLFDSVWSGIVILCIALLQLLWMLAVRHRIEFATALIVLSVQSLHRYKASYLVSVFGMLLQSVWAITWLMGFSYAVDGTSATKLVIFLYVIAFYWTFQVISNIVLTSISGTVAVWYFLYPTYTITKPVSGALKRSLTTSFGSICYGSLIVAVVQFIRLVVGMLRSMVRERSDNLCVRCIAACIQSLVQCFQDIIEYINNYAFVRVAIYGLDYCSSARQTLQLFRSRGFDLVINDDLTNAVLMLSCLFTASFTALIIGAISKYAYNDNSAETVLLWSFTAFAVSFALSISCMVTIKAAVCTIFVCFAEDPASLSHTKPYDYEFLTNAWNKRYGSLPKKLTNPARM